MRDLHHAAGPEGPHPDWYAQLEYIAEQRRLVGGGDPNWSIERHDPDWRDKVDYNYR